MATSKFTPPAVPFDASPGLRAWLDEQMRRLQVLVNEAIQPEDVASLEIAESQITDGSLLARLADDETITGDWTFSAGLQAGNAGTFAAESSGSVADDGTYQFSGGNGLWFVFHTTNRQNACAIVFIDTNGDLVEIFAGSTTSTGTANPDIDGQLNVYVGAGGGVEIKNRFGVAEEFIAWKFLV